MFVPVVAMLGLMAARALTSWRIREPSAEARLIFTMGKAIADPFRQREVPDNADTRSWIDAEQKLTEKWLVHVPQRRAMKDRLTRLFDYEPYPASTSRGFTWSFAGAFSAGRHHFRPRNSDLQNQIAL